MTAPAYWHRLWAAYLIGFVAYVAAGFVLDFIAYRKAGNDATFSIWFTDLCRAWLIIPVTMSLVAGGMLSHWFAPIMRRLSDMPLGALLAELARREPPAESGTSTTTVVRVTATETTTAPADTPGPPS